MGTQPVSGRARQSDPPIQSAWKHLLQSRSVRILSNFLLLPLVTALISGMIIGRLVDKFTGSKNYFVYVVGDDSDKSTSDLTTEKMPDGGDPERAGSNGEELQHRSDVLMVVGHGSSTSSKRALPHYLQADPPIPVILTTETNPALYTPPTRDEDRVPPVFRLFPTDDNQAEVAANFIAKEGAKSVWVVEDTSRASSRQKGSRLLATVAAQSRRLELNFGLRDHLLVSDRGRGEVALFS